VDDGDVKDDGIDGGGDGAGDVHGLLVERVEGAGPLAGGVGVEVKLKAKVGAAGVEGAEPEAVQWGWGGRLRGGRLGQGRERERQQQGGEWRLHVR
jgi:hypothetical protein